MLVWQLQLQTVNPVKQPYIREARIFEALSLMFTNTVASQKESKGQNYKMHLKHFNLQLTYDMET